MEFTVREEEPRECWYRVTDWRSAPPLDEWERPIGRGESHVTVHEYPVLRHTAKGVWLEAYYGAPRFVLHGTRKRFACPTVEEAWESFRARKARQARILEAQLQHVREVMNANPPAVR